MNGFPVLIGCPNTKDTLLYSMSAGLDEEGARCWSVSAGDLPIQPNLWNCFRYRRCLVPVTSLILDRVNSEGKRKSLRLLCASTPIISLAGIWNSFIGEDERELQVFQVITVHPTALLSPFFDRLPVIIPDHARERWLHGAESTLPIELLQPLSAAEMKHWMMLPAEQDLNAELLEPESAVCSNVYTS